MQIERFRQIIEPIVSSNMVEGYAVGITKNSNNRRHSYKGVDWPYFYIIEIELSQEKALELEQFYFRDLTSDKHSIFYKKYHPDKRDEGYKGSVGGVGQTSEQYCIYIAAF